MKWYFNNPFIYLSTFLRICVSICLYIYLSIHSSIFLYTYIYLSIYLSVNLSTCISIYLLTYLAMVWNGISNNKKCFDFTAFYLKKTLKFMEFSFQIYYTIYVCIVCILYVCMCLYVKTHLLSMCAYIYLSSIYLN